MSDNQPPGASAPMFQEIRTAGPERTYKFRSITFLSFATLSAVGLSAAARLLQFAALVGQWLLLTRMAGHGFLSQDDVMTAARSSDRLVLLTTVLGLVTLVPAYVISSFWIYNAACNIRALGARGMQISPGWAVGWFAVPVAALVMPFQGIEEIYQASSSPAGWRKLQTPMLLRLWWGLWLVSGLAGGVIGVIANNKLPIQGLITVTELMLANGVVAVATGVLFLIVVWRVYRAQMRSHSIAGEVAQVFA